jgi:hypothetical protein
MKSTILAGLAALAVTAGIAAAGIASLADGATTLINATAYSGPHGNVANSLGGCSVFRSAEQTVRLFLEPTALTRNRAI